MLRVKPWLLTAAVRRRQRGAIAAGYDWQAGHPQPAAGRQATGVAALLLDPPKIADQLQVQAGQQGQVAVTQGGELPRPKQVAPPDPAAPVTDVATEVAKVRRALHGEPALSCQHRIAVLIADPETVSPPGRQAGNPGTACDPLDTVPGHAAVFRQRLHPHFRIRVAGLPLHPVVTGDIAPDMDLFGFQHYSCSASIAGAAPGAPSPR